MLGESAGRGARHKVRPSARRRFNEQERKANTPLPDDTEEWPDDVRENKMLQLIGDIVSATLAAVFTLIAVTMYTRVPTWPGMVSLGALTTFVSGLAIASRRRR